MNPIRIMVVDDHDLAREGIRAFLETQSDIEVIAEASSGEEAINKAELLVPEVILMDLLMPGIDGVEATRQIKQISPHTQIVILTSYHDDEHIFPALKAGAISYILKDVKIEELGNTVRRAAQGEATLHPRIATRVLAEMRGDLNPQEKNPWLLLTKREMEILRLIAKGLSNQEIADQLVISENTVKAHVSNILSKLHLADRTQAAIFAWRQGIINRQALDNQEE